MTITPTQWLVLDNLRNGWHYRTNLCDWDAADTAYRWAVENEYIKDGQLTHAGKLLLMTCSARGDEPA